MKPSEIHVVEYSPIQKCYHTDTLDRVCKINQEITLRGLKNEYDVIGAFESREEADRCIDQHREEMNQKVKA